MPESDEAGAAEGTSFIFGRGYASPTESSSANARMFRGAGGIESMAAEIDAFL
jgi:hypothetical protein